MTKDLFVEIGGVAPDTVTVDIREDLTLSEDLERELDIAAANFGYYAVLAEKAAAKLERAKTSFELWKSVQGESLVEEHGNFKTLKEMERKISMMPKYRKYRLKICEYQENASVLSKIAKAFEIKSSMVQTKNANRRREMK